MAKRFFQNRTAVFTTFAVLLIALIGIFAPVIAPCVLTTYLSKRDKVGQLGIRWEKAL